MNTCASARIYVGLSLCWALGKGAYPTEISEADARAFSRFVPHVFSICPYRILNVIFFRYLSFLDTETKAMQYLRFYVMLTSVSTQLSLEVSYT